MESIQELRKGAYIVRREEEVFQQLNNGATGLEVAHFMATHPDIRRKWQEDVIDLERQERNSL